jgi:MoaA/NifB/PqqE/SkfB family radical SAM enzyme
MSFIRGLGSRAQNSSGLKHLHVMDGTYRGLRLHLRFEEDGSGVLVINASRVLFLNSTAAQYASLFIEGKTEREVIGLMRRRYKVDEETVTKDYKEVLFVVNTFAKTPDVCPVSYLGVEKLDPFQKELSAPYRMDLAITYRCATNCVHRYTEGPREMKELSTEEWFKVLDKLYDLGIPHVVFTGGEPTVRDDITKLVAHTQEIGLVSGLATDGRRLKDAAYFNSLVEAGLDHVQITVESYDPKVHDKITGAEGSWDETIQGLKKAIASPIYTLSNTTLNKWNVEDILKTIEFLQGLGLRQFACNSLVQSGKEPTLVKDFALEEPSLEPILTEIQHKAHELGMEFTWYTPIEYGILDPLQLDQGIKSCIACRTTMCIEPDGTVIPCQSYFTPLGNILKDDWKKIWRHPLCIKLRARKFDLQKCYDCPSFNI